MRKIVYTIGYQCKPLATFIGQLRESLRSYAQEDADEFVQPATVADEVLAEGLRTLEGDESSLLAFAGTRFEIDADTLRSSFVCED